MNRCKKRFRLINSRCILKDGHDQLHCYPNAKLKREYPEIWNDLRYTEKPWNGDLETLASKLLKNGDMILFR